MARNKKVEILSNDKEVLHPMTDGDCVIFEDGQTLTQKLSEDDSVKYTPEIVNSSPMFKVGEGNTVDYSDNVLDGAYERATLQGQTYVNYIQESSADEVTLPTPFTEYERTQHNTLTSDEEGTLGINLVGQSYVNALQHDSEEEYVVLGESLEFQEKKVEYTNEGQIKSAMLKGQTLVNMFKSFANYTYSASEIGVKWLIGGAASLTETLNDDELTMTITSVGSKVVRMDNASMLKPNTKYMVKINYTTSFENQINFGYFNNSLIYTQIANMKSNEYAIFTTPNDLSTWVGLWFGVLSNLQVGDVITISKPVLFEYQDGMENWDIPYFEGMQSVTVSTRLENLCHKHTTSSLAKTGKTFTTSSLSNRALCLSSIDDGGADTIYGMKPNTKYLVQFKISNLVLDGLDSLAMQFSVSGTASGNCLFVDGIRTGLITTDGVYRVVLTTTDLVSTSSVEIKGVAEQWEESGSSLRSMTISEIMCVEYQNGMENWDLPYFEDYQVMKPVQVETTNRNLFDMSKNDKLYYCDMVAHNNSSFTLTGTGTAHYKNAAFKINVKPNTDYYIQVSSEVISGNSDATFDIYSIDNKYLYGGQITKFNSGDNTWLSFRFYVNINNTNTGSVKYTVQLEESSTATEYVPHQSKTTYSWDEVILRKIGDVEDTLDLTTGEWVQRIGEVVLDGNSENWVVGSYTEIPFHIQGELPNNCIHEINSTKILASYNQQIFQNSSYGSVSATSYYRIRGIVFCPPEGITTREQAIEYIQANPIKVQYQLATPIVHKVNLSRPNLQVYDDITYVHTKCLDGTLIPNIYLPSDISYPAILEPSTTYNVCIDHTEVNADNPLKVNVGGTEITMTDSRMTLTTPATLANSNVSFTGKGNKIKESMLIKNSSLLTRDLPHFNGIGSVQLGKTIENLCGSSCERVGTGGSTKSETDNSITITATKQGSIVCCFELTTLLENGKKYFVYCPSSITTTITSKIQMGFKRTYNGVTGYLRQPAGTSKTQYIIDQVDNQYTHLTVGCHGTLNVGDVYTIQRPIICEYEPGMENWDWESIGYFTGTKNIGNEFMRISNKNLFDGTFYGGYFDSVDGNGIPVSVGSLTVYKTIRINLKKGEYTISFPEYCNIIRELKDGNVERVNTNNVVKNYTFIINNDGLYAFAFRKTDSTDVPNNFSVQLEEASSATSYVAHKHNSLHILPNEQIPLAFEQGAIIFSTTTSFAEQINNTMTTRIRTGLLDLEPNETYRISFGDKNYICGIAFYDNSNIGLNAVSEISNDYVFTTTKDVHKICINIAKSDMDANITPSVLHQVRLEKVTNVTLRSVGNVKDELDLTRGVYIQRIGEIVIDGSQITGYSTNNTQDSSTMIRCYIKLYDGYNPTIPKNERNVAPLSNQFIGRVWTTFNPIKSVIIGGSYDIHFILYTSDLSENSLNGCKKYFKDLYDSGNPVIVQYQLETPIEHKINIPMKNELNQTIAKPNGIFTLPTLYTEQTHIDLTNNGIIPKVQSRDYITYPVSPMINRTYTLQHNLTGGVSNLTVDLLGRTQSVSYQNHKSLVYTPETILHNELRISGKGKISRVIYLDGGYMDRDIPYIEGMKNAVNPIVKNVGKNLIDNSILLNAHPSHNYLWTKDHYYQPSIKLNPNKPYKLSLSSFKGDGRIILWSNNKKTREIEIDNLNMAFTTSSNENGFSFYAFVVNDGNTDNVNIQLEESPTTSQYEPYEENICYVDCGEIRLTPDMFEQGNVVYNGANTGATYDSMKEASHIRIRVKELIKIKPNTKYLLNVKGGYRVLVREFDVNKGKLNDSALSLIEFQSRAVFTTNANTQYISLLIGNLSDTSLPLSDFNEFNLLLIEEDDMVILRSLPNGVHDEIDLETGKYIQRVGEVILDGSEEWKFENNTFRTTAISNKVFNQITISHKTKHYLTSDKYATIAYNDSWESGKFIVLHVDNRIVIKDEDFTTQDWVRHLQQNPITVQYELAEPIVKDIVIHNYPHSYEGGHVIIENGDPNTPIPAQLTYRAVTNRSGQIQQHTEQVEKQEREINELETLILANIHLSQTR